MSNQYEVLGKAPTPEDLKKLSPNEIHLTIKNLNAGYGKMEILHDFDLNVSKAQSLCLIGPNGAGKSTILHSIYGFTNKSKLCRISIFPYPAFKPLIVKCTSLGDNFFKSSGPGAFPNTSY